MPRTLRHTPRPRSEVPSPAPVDSRLVLPAGHPLQMWEFEEAMEHTKLGEETLRNSQCPRAKVGSRVLFDPVETILWVRSHLTHTMSQAPASAPGDHA